MLRAVRNKDTRRIIEAENGVRSGVMIAKAVAAGHDAGALEEVELDDSELISLLREQNFRDASAPERRRIDILREIPVEEQLKELWDFVATISPAHPMLARLDAIKKRHPK